MIDIPPPPLIIDPPAIIRPLEGGLWGDLDRKMSRLGLARHIRRSIIVEMRKVVGAKTALVRATAAEMAHYGKDPFLASMLINPFLLAPAAPSGPTVVYQNTDVVPDTGAAHQYTNAPIGTAAADRLVIVASAARRNAAGVRTITGVTIGGNAATINIQTNVTGSSGITVGIASLVVAAGTTATIIVSYSGFLSQGFISVYTVTGLTSTTATNTASATGSNPSSSTIDITGPGILVASFAAADGTLGDMTMVGVTEDYDQTSPASTTTTFMRGGAGSASGLATETNRTISVSSSANIEALAAASWT